MFSSSSTLAFSLYLDSASSSYVMCICIIRVCFTSSLKKIRINLLPLRFRSNQATAVEGGGGGDRARRPRGRWRAR